MNRGTGSSFNPAAPDPSFQALIGRIRNVKARYKGLKDQIGLASELSYIMYEFSWILENVPFYDGTGVPNSPDVLGSLDVEQVLNEMSDINDVWRANRRGGN